MLGNFWQFYSSILYLIVNNLLSSMLLAKEWDGYIKNTKTLRVSHPVGIQQSSFFLSMPLKYGVPLVGSMALLHFCVSQSIFVTRLVQYMSNGEISPGSEWISSLYSSNATISCKFHLHHHSSPTLTVTDRLFSSYPGRSNNPNRTST